MAVLKNVTCLLVLLAVFSLVLGQTSQGGPHTSQGSSHESQGGSHESQGGPHENQGRAKRQAEVYNEVVVSWTTCDPAVTARNSCQDCNTRLVCTSVGGKVIRCPSVYAPYCNNGYCSRIPSAGCA